MADNDTRQRRLRLVADCIARGLPHHEIISVCQADPLFQDKLGRSLDSKSIRNHYIYKVRRMLAIEHRDPLEELRIQAERLEKAYRTALEMGQVAAAVAALRERNRLMGLRQEVKTIRMEGEQRAAIRIICEDDDHGQEATSESGGDPDCDRSGADGAGEGDQ